MGHANINTNINTKTNTHTHTHTHTHTYTKRPTPTVPEGLEVKGLAAGHQRLAELGDDHVGQADAEGDVGVHQQLADSPRVGRLLREVLQVLGQLRQILRKCK